MISRRLATAPRLVRCCRGWQLAHTACPSDPLTSQPIRRAATATGTLSDARTVARRPHPAHSIVATVPDPHFRTISIPKSTSLASDYFQRPASSYAARSPAHASSASVNAPSPAHDTGPGRE